MHKSVLAFFVSIVIHQVSFAETQAPNISVITPAQMQQLITPENTEAVPLRRWPYGEHDRYMMTLALQQHYKGQATDIHFSGSWNLVHGVVNAESYFQFMGDGIASIKDSWEVGFFMRQWRRYVDANATVVNPTDRAYLAIYTVDFKVNGQVMSCYEMITKMGHKNSPHKKDIYRIELKSCNISAWDIEDKTTFDKLVEGN